MLKQLKIDNNVENRLKNMICNEYDPMVKNRIWKEIYQPMIHPNLEDIIREILYNENS